MPPAPSRTQHLAGPDVGRGRGLYPQVFLRVDRAGQHGVVSRSMAADQRRLSQPVEKRLYAWFRWRCIAARARRRVVRGDRLHHGAVLGHRRGPQRRRIVVVLELLVQRPGALVPQHLDDRDQRAVPRRLGDADVEQLVAGQRLLVGVELPLHHARALPRWPRPAASSPISRRAPRIRLRSRGARAAARTARPRRARRAAPRRCLRPPGPARRSPTRSAPRPGPRPRARSAPRAPTAATRRAASRGRAPAAAARPAGIRPSG